MNTDRLVPIDRRNFLKSAAVLAGAVVLDIPLQARATAAGGSGNVIAPAANATPSATTISYWNQKLFVDPGKIVSGDASLLQTGVHVSIHDHFVPAGSESILNACIPVFAVPGAAAPGTSNLLPFYAWSATSSPHSSSCFFAPVSIIKGLGFSIETIAVYGTLEPYFLSVDSVVNTAKLRVGTYAVAAGSPDWRGYSLVTGKGGSRVLGPGGKSGSPPNFEYLLITITKG